MAAFISGCIACRWMINIVKKGKIDLVRSLLRYRGCIDDCFGIMSKWGNIFLEKERIFGQERCSWSINHCAGHRLTW